MNGMLPSKILRSFLGIALVLGCTTLGQFDRNVASAFANNGAKATPAATNEAVIETFTQDTTTVSIKQSTDDSGAIVETWAYLEPTSGDTGEMSSLTNWKASTKLNAIQRVETKEPAAGQTYTIKVSGSMQAMFSGFSELTTIEGLKYWDTSAATSFKELFYNCSSLSDITPLSSWGTANVTSLQWMFTNCSMLESISALANWNTAKVTNMNRLIDSCSKITTLDALKNWSITSLKYMERAFYNCEGLIDVSALSSWNMTSISNYSRLFGQMSAKQVWKIERVGIPSGKDTFFTDFAGSAITPEYYGDTYKYKTADGRLLTTDEASADYANLAGQVLEIVQIKNIESASVFIDESDLTYSGEAKTPALNVEIEGQTLVADVDYSATFSNNINAGEASVKIEGIGQYTGIQEKKFTITKKDATITPNSQEKVYGAQLPNLSATIEGLVGSDTLTLGTDYNLSTDATDTSIVGNYSITASIVNNNLTSNYKFTLTTGEFKVTGKPLNDADITTSSIAKQEYTGEAISPTVTIKYGDYELVQDTDYSLSYSNNINVGTATVTISGIGNFSGSITTNFEIYDNSSPTPSPDPKPSPDPDPAPDPSPDPKPTPKIVVNTIKGNGKFKINGTSVTGGQSISSSADQSVSISWQPEKVGSRNVTLIKSITVNSKDQNATTKIDKKKWQVVNEAYKREMGDASAVMTTYDKVISTEQSLSVNTANALGDVTIDVEFAEYVPVYRLYNMITSEHMFTTNKNEYDSFVNQLEEGKDVWIGEGIDWFAEVTPTVADTNTVRRFYNAALGAMGRSSHYYSKDATEIATLLNNGWVNDGEANYIQSGGDVPIWTCYNEGLGSAHHYTSNKTEWEGLEQHGWALEKDKNLTTGVFQAVMSAKP